MGGFNKRCGAYSRKYGTKRYYDGFKRRPQISAAFLEKKISTLRYISYALCNLTFTNKLLVKGQNNNNKKTCKPEKSFSFLFKKFTAKTVDEDPVACQLGSLEKRSNQVKY